MYKRILQTIALLAYASMLVLPLVPQGALAQATVSTSTSSDCQDGTVCLYNPLGTNSDSYDIRLILGRVIRGILSIVGSLALLMFIYGGILWMTSNGKAESVKKGRDIIVWAIAGLVIIFSSYAIVNAILNAVTQGSISGTTTS